MSDTARAPVRIRRSQAERREESERQLMAATMAIVATRGVSAATLDAIGEEAGYSRGLAAKKFGSKVAVMEAVIAHLQRQREEIIAAEHLNEMPALDAIGHFIEQLARELRREYSRRAYVMLMASAVADASPMSEAFAASNDRWLAWLEDTIRRGQRVGSIRPEADPSASALMIGSLLLGMSMQWLVNPKTDIDLIAKSSIAAIRQSLSIQPKQQKGARR
jgi:AcrR family transcriptional regulator